jgi:antitoxin component YwqK of YwqJK toxin-antitoxin module
MKWFILIVSLGMVACSGKVVITESEIKPDVFYANDSYKPFTGKCYVVFSDTNLIKEQFTYYRGQLHGEALSYHKNGQLRRKGYFLYGQLSGKWELWDEKGNKIMEAGYLNDSLNGAYITLYENGKVKETGQYANNIRIGRWMKYDENGQLVEKLFIRN